MKQSRSRWVCRPSQLADVPAIVACWYGVEIGSDENHTLSLQLTSAITRLQHCWVAWRDHQIEAVIWFAMQSVTYAHCWPLRSVYEASTTAHRDVAQELWHVVHAHYQHQGVRTFQTLVPTENNIDLLTMTQLGFRQTACIQRLEFDLAVQATDTASSQITLVPVTGPGQPLFNSTLHETFIDSMDVPELNLLDPSTRDSQLYWEAGLQRFLLQHSLHGVIGVAVLDGYQGETVLRYLGVRPGHRRQGYGQQALAMLMQIARSQGCRHIEVRVDTRNVPALRLYAEQGFMQFDAEAMLLYPPLTSP